MSSEPESSQGSDLQVLAKGGALNVAGSVAAVVLGLLLVVVVTRGLHAHGAGVFFEAVGLFSILASATQLGADTGLVRSISRFRALGRTGDLRPLVVIALGPVLAIGTVLAAVVYLEAPRLVPLLMRGADIEDGVRFLRILALFLPFAAATTVCLSGARGFGTMLPYVAIEQLVKPLLRPLLAIGVIAAGLGAGAVAVAWAVPVAIGFPIAVVALLVLLRRAEHRADHGVGPSGHIRALWREFWSFAAPRGMATLFQVSIIWLGILLIGALATTREAGIYAAASRFALIGLFALDAVRLAIAPQMSALLARKDLDRAQQLYQVGTWWLMVPSWPLYLLTAVFSPVLLRVFGSDFVAGQTALMILALAMLVNMGTGNVTVVLLMGGKSWWNLLNTFGALVINVGLSLVLIPRYGMTGAALAWSASILWENLVPLFQIRALFKLHPFGRGYLLVGGAALACYGVLGIAVRWLIGPTPMALVLTGIAGTALYLPILWRARRLLQFSALRDGLRFTRRLRSRPRVAEAGAVEGP